MPICLPSFAGTTTPASGAAFTNQYSVDFDGTNDYLLMGTSAISLDTNFTISAWFKPTSDALAGYDFMVGWGNNASGQSRVMQILNSKLSFEIYYSRISGSTTLSADTWYHGAVTFSGNDVEIFLNGLSDGTGTLSRSTMASSLTFAGGTPTMTSVGFIPFSGLIDEFAVFDSVLSSTAISSIYNSGVPNDISSLSPVGWWRMGDNDGATGTTITDQGSGGNNGTLTNGPTFSTSVPEYVFNQYSVDFDGTNDYMAAGNITALNSVANASYSFWYKTSATGKVGLLGGGAGTSAYHWSDGNMYVHSFVNTLSHPITIPTLGAWHHVVCTFEASGSKLYLDGSLQSTVDHGDTTASNAGNGFQVGRVPHYSIPDGQKLIDEVALFTSTLSASDVSAIYNSGVPADLTSYSPVNWWRMGDNDSGTGTTITDQGSGSNDGTLTNGPTFSTTVPT
jgi:hypothetical protein